MDFIVTINGHFFQGGGSQDLYRQMEKWNHEQVRISLVLHRSSRSINQNNYYWGVVLNNIFSFLKESGQFEGVNCPEDVHHLMSIKFLAKWIYVNGTKLRIPGSTSRLSTEEFASYIDKIVSWAATNLDLHIPPPNNMDSL